jgi:opacity protein-like surface antigen
MKRMVLAVLALVCLANVAVLSAQQGIRVGIGGGVVMPIGDYKDVDKLGWLAGADLTYWLTSSPVGIRLDGSYSQTSHKDFQGVAIAGNSKIVGGLVEVVYALGTQADQIRPYILGGGGVYNLKVHASAQGTTVDTSETKFAFGFGAGVAFKVGAGSTRFFVEGKFVSIKESGGSTNFLPIRAGIRFGGGSK